MKYSLQLMLLFAANLFPSDQALFSSAPVWVSEVEITDSEEIPLSKVKKGTHYLHFGRQVRVPRESEPEY